MRRAVRFSALAFFCAALAGTALSTALSQDRHYNRRPGTAATTPAPEARIDINRASVEELMKVPGMTRTWAGRIVRFRPYHTKLDLLERGVVTSEVYARIKDAVIAHRVLD